MSSKQQPLPGDIIKEDDLMQNIDKYMNWLQSIDVILLLGGGVPISSTEPPVYVQRRCDVVAEIMNISMHRDPSVICLSAGTAHVPQYIHEGLPLWESTASAAYLINHKQYPIDPSYVYAETTSYDTISNAYFTRTTMTDVNTNWNRILVVTNEFHIRRSAAIFDWIFHAPSVYDGSPKYELYFLSVSNIGLSQDALISRKEHEARGEANVHNVLAKEYTTLQDIWRFLTTKHDFYSAEKLVQRATNMDIDRSDNLLKMSYGRKVTSSTIVSTEYKDGHIVLSLDLYFLVIALLLSVIVGVYYSHRRNKKQHNL